MDPYKVLNVPKNFTLEQLKSAYKRKVMKYHPDLTANVKSTPLFQALTESYKMLLEDLKLRQEQPSHYEMKSEYKSIDKRTEYVKPREKFDLDRFNHVFDDNRLKDDYIDSGYNEWLNTEQHKIKEKAIVNYNEPEAIGDKYSSQFFELGMNKVSDYSQLNGCGSLQFMDLKKALTISKIVDEKHVENRESFNSLNEIKKHRAKAKFDMTPEELRQYHADTIKRQEREERRQIRQMKKDKIAQEHYDRVHNLLTNNVK
jgi:curved DNA-binding protein CbpA